MHVILSPSTHSTGSGQAGSPRLRSGQAGQAPRRILWVEPPSKILRRPAAGGTPQNDSERRIAQFRRQSVGVSFSYENLLFLLKFLYAHL